MIDQESILYAVTTAAIGILVVFLFLLFLSVLMSLLQRFFGSKGEIPQTNRPEPQPSKTVTAVNKVPTWVLAALSLYLFKKDELKEA